MKKDGKEVKIGKSIFCFKLENVMNDRNISKNKLSQDTNTDYKVVTRYLNGEIQKLDLFVIERFCNYLDCDLSDIIELKKRA